MYSGVDVLAFVNDNLRTDINLTSTLLAVRGVTGMHTHLLRHMDKPESHFGMIEDQPWLTLAAVHNALRQFTSMDAIVMWHKAFNTMTRTWSRENRGT